MGLRSKRGTKISDVDFTQNCHGYSFGKGDWLEKANTLLAAPCYTKLLELVAIKDATIAADRPKHSIIAKGTQCLINAAGLGAILFGATIESSEQFRESGTYKRTAGCPGLELSDAMLNGGMNFNFYKQ